VKELLAQVCRGQPLDEAQAGAAMDTLMDGEATPAQIGALLAAIAVRGETEDEVVGFARAMRARGRRLHAPGAIDTCGTGGDGAGTFNISTVASLVVAGCGVRVAKHGNRSVSSRCGSADVLEALGVRIDADPERVQRCLDEVGWGFLFAPAFHASTRHAAAPRRELGMRTVFNLLGPLTNPAFPEAQVVGVPRPELTAFLARCLGRLGVKRAWVVHGEGLDELTPGGTTRVAELSGGHVREFEVGPEDAGLERHREPMLAAHGPEDSARVVQGILGGERGAPRDAVLLNAAAALMVAGRAKDLRDGAAQAATAIDDGRASRVLERVREATR
jgi:anthranilate phosphoribosyltransferase